MAAPQTNEKAHDQPFLVGDWLVEPSLNRMSCADQQVILVPKVMALLQVLATHTDTPLSQDKIIELVWPGQVVSDSSVYQAIAQLRKAFGDSASEARYIERVSGKGYRLIAKISEPEFSIEKPKSFMPVFAISAIVLIGLLVWLLFSVGEKGEHNATEHPLDSVTLVDLQLPQDTQTGALGALNQVLLSQLTNVEGLKVVQAKRTPETLSTEALLTGNIQIEDDKIQAYLQLTKTRDNEVLWAQVFEGTTGKVYQLQERMVSALLTQLQTKQTNVRFAAERVDERVFDQYLLARHLWQQRSVSALQQSRQIFEQMRDKEQLFPLAAVGLCETYHFLHIYSDWSLQKALNACQPLLDGALERQPDLGEALASKALLLSTQGKRKQAEALFKQAIAKAPNYAFGFMWYGNLIRDLGQYDRALEVTRRAYELAPMSPVVNRTLAYAYLTNTRFSDARYYYQRALTLDPDHYVRPVQNLDFLPLSVARASDFLQWQKQNPQMMAKRAYFRLTLAQIELSLGRISQAESIFNALEPEAINPAFFLYMQASINTAKGNLVEASEQLRQRMLYHSDKRRFVIPYLSNLLYRGKADEAYQTIIEFAPELPSQQIEITADNQYLVAFYIYIQEHRGHLDSVRGLIERLDSWLGEKPQMLDHYYVHWLVFTGHEDAKDKLIELLEQGWLPDYNEDMLSVQHVRAWFEQLGLGAALFDELLQKNRAITLNYI